MAPSRRLAKEKLMKYFTTLSVITAAIAALMAFAASASATTVTDSSGKTPTIHAVSEESAVAGTNQLLIHNPIANIPCESTFQGTVPSTSEGGTGLTVSLPVSSLSFSPCSNSWTPEVLAFGSLEIHGGSGNQGTLTSTGIKVAFERFKLRCTYETSGTLLGTVTGGNPATIHLNATLKNNPKESNFLCANIDAKLTGSYKTTGTIDIDQ